MDTFSDPFSTIFSLIFGIFAILPIFGHFGLIGSVGSQILMDSVQKLHQKMGKFIDFHRSKCGVPKGCRNAKKWSLTKTPIQSQGVMSKLTFLRSEENRENNHFLVFSRKSGK